jgi:formate/nitrite transporter FocA (FNT family)
MDPSRERYYRGLFLVAAIYDGVLGIVFTFFYGPAFELLEVTPPEGGYIPLLGSFLFVIGVAYYLIWRGDLFRNRDMIFVGTLYKLAYAAIALIYWAIGDVPHVAFAAVFGLADMVFFILMLECWLRLRRQPTPGETRAVA